MNDAGSVCVLGAGIAGMTAANQLSRNGFDVWLVDKLGYPGGRALRYGCKATEECSHCGVCLVRDALRTLKSDKSIHFLSGSVLTECSHVDSGYAISLERSANRIDRAACNECGTCVDACPEGSIERIPGWGFAIGDSCTGCGACETACEFDAISTASEREGARIDADFVVVATGFDAFDPTTNRKWGFPESERVFTASTLEESFFYERYMPDSDADHIAFIQCVGSRSVTDGSPSCSRVCCSYALRMANRIKAENPDITIDFYHMDIQHTGDFHEELMERARNSVRFIRSNPISVAVDQHGFPIVRYESPPDWSIAEERYDYLVLSNGILPGAESDYLASRVGLDVTFNGFLRVPGAPKDRFVIGAAAGPCGIQDSVAQAHDVVRSITIQSTGVATV